VSSKTHGPDPDPLKTFVINLPLTGTPLGIECRRNTGTDTSGPNMGRDHQVIVTFPSAVTVGGVSVTSNQSADQPQATFSVSGNVVTVDLHNIANARRLTVNLLKVSDGSATDNVSIPMGVLFADVNASKRTDSGDVTAVRNRTVTIPTDDATARFDVNVSSRIDAGDVTATRNATVTILP
jgi:hypothetical protein